MNRALQSVPADPQQAHRDAHVVREIPQVPLDRKTYLTSAETVAYLGLPSLNALKKRMQRRSIPTWTWTRMGGKSLRFVRASLDEWLQKRHGATVAAPSAQRNGNSVTRNAVAPSGAGR